MASGNADDAEKCLRIAREALREGNAAKAERFAEKAYRLFPTAKVRLLLLCLVIY